MKTYDVSFLAQAQDQILEAYDWGVETWGKERADTWLRSLYVAIFAHLSAFPFSCPVAPESQSLKREVRHYVFNRYRIIFDIRENSVIVLRLTGPFNSREVDIGFE